MNFIFTFLMLVSQGETPKSGQEVLEAMRARYNGTWYRTLSFIQKTTNTDKDGKTTVETWFERILAPGFLRIDVSPYETGNGFMFANDSVYVMKNGTLVRSARRINELQLLGFDVYFYPVEKTADELRGLGVNLSVVHEETFEGNPAYVVGAASGDLTSTQFWVDKERMIFLRWIRRGVRDTTQMVDVRFRKYEKILAGGWIEREVTMLINGKEATREEYSDIKTRIELQPETFLPSNWMKTLPR